MRTLHAIQCQKGPGWLSELGSCRGPGWLSELGSCRGPRWLSELGSCWGPGWLSELGSWITQQSIQVYHQYGVGSRPVCKLQKGCTRLAAASDRVYQSLAHGQWFSPGTPAFSTAKTGRHDIAEILLEVALKHQKINQINRPFCQT